MRANMLWLFGALMLTACADTANLEKEVADLKRRVTQLEKAGGGAAKGAKAGKAKAGKATKAKAGKAGKAGKAKGAKAGKAKAPAGPKVAVELTGDATKVSLNNGKRGFSVPGEIPVGEYTIQAAFAGDAALADVGSLTVVEGAAITVSCSSANRACAQQ